MSRPLLALFGLAACAVLAEPARAESPRAELPRVEPLRPQPARFGAASGAVAWSAAAPSSIVWSGGTSGAISSSGIASSGISSSGISSSGIAASAVSSSGPSSAVASSAVASSTDAVRLEPARVAWNDAWPRFRATEAIVTGVMLLPIAGALFLYPNPDDNLHGGFLFDNAVRDAIVLDNASARDRAAQLSNLPYLGLLAFPLLVDTALVTAGIHGEGDVALEMLAMDLESFAISGAISLTFQKLGRVRPSEKGCATDPNYAPKCDNPVAMNQSFLSGHTSIAFTGAGLTCAHHRNLPLYGGGWPDVAICVAALAAASTTGALRLMSDNHYASDVLLGVGVGLASGWALPEWLHYSGGTSADAGAGEDAAGAGAGAGARGERGARRSRGLLPTFSGDGWSALLAPQLGAGALGLTLIARH